MCSICLIWPAFLCCAAERKGLEHLVVAGGPCACNPEPLADFVDLFSSAKEKRLTASWCVFTVNTSRRRSSKETFLREAAQIPGVYVPSLYKVSYGEDGTDLRH